MYWIYLFLFIFIIFTPKIIQDGFFFLREEDIESLIILCFGVLAFVLYLAKEKELLKVFREKLHLQRKTNDITKDLSDSYSYIGGMNRKFDIVKNLIFHLPEDTSDALAKEHPETFQSIIQAIQLLSKGESVSLRFVNTKTGQLEKIIERGPPEKFAFFNAKKLLASGKVFWENPDCAVVRSPREAKNKVVYIIFPKATNQIEDVEMFKILASQALLLYCVA
ncbi:MAG: hypothetical protein AUK19_00065 [Candidatus Moranbacteria bacterium CG2_30_45_14]|nr:MAG: hypothetical protein AUK19_00065 [Candidatus Moranbacteria bacterium CG2_30_45_14]